MPTLDVGLDLDGVCYDLVGALRTYLHRARGVPLHELPPATCWEFYAADWGMTTAEFLDACHQATDCGQLFWDGAPYPDTDWALHRLRADGHRIHVVTARSFGRPGAAKQASKCWLERHRLPFDTLTVTEDKTSVDVDVFIDDRPANYDALEVAGCRPYLFTRPWNREHPGRRVDTWAEFVAAVDQFARVRAAASRVAHLDGALR